MTIVSIHQPIYLPWLAYFDKIRRSDIHVVLDHVTVGKQDLCNRNKIRTAQGWEWLTIPIKNKGSRSTAITDIETFDPKGSAGNKHWELIQRSYRCAPRWEQHKGFLKAVTSMYSAGLLNIPVGYALGYLCGVLNVFPKTSLIYSAHLRARGQKSDLNLNICRELGATKYLSGPFGRTYLDIPSFEKAGIEVEFTDYQHPVYQQCQPGDFIPGMSAIDAMLNGYVFS